MMDNKSDADLKLIFQFSVDLDTFTQKRSVTTSRFPHVSLNNVSHSITHFVDDVMRQSGQDSEGVSKVADDVHYVLHHIGRKAGLHGNSFHPLGKVVSHTQNVFVSVECLGQRPSDIQTKPLPRLCHLPTQHDIMEKYSHYRNTSLY